MAFATSSISAYPVSGSFSDSNVHFPATVRLPRHAVTAAYVSERTARVHAVPPHRSGGSLYEVLGVQVGATCQEIKAAYRRLARVVHPDVNSNNGQNGSYEFVKLHEAYAALSDPDTRADYDRVLLTRRLKSSLSTAGVSGSSAARYGGYASGRRWETDQCW